MSFFSLQGIKIAALIIRVSLYHFDGSLWTFSNSTGFWRHGSQTCDVWMTRLFVCIIQTAVTFLVVPRVYLASSRLELHRLRNLSVSELLFRLLYSHSTRVKITLGDYGQHPAFTQGSNLPKWQGLQIEPRTSDPQPRAISITSLCLLHINGAQPTLIAFL